MTQQFYTIEKFRKIPTGCLFLPKKFPSRARLLDGWESLTPFDPVPPSGKIRIAWCLLLGQGGQKVEGGVG
jgi:hypothetical protein